MHMSKKRTNSNWTVRFDPPTRKRWSSRMYNHSKMCLSTSWNANLADSNCDWAAKYLRSV